MCEVFREYNFVLVVVLLLSWFDDLLHNDEAIHPHEILHIIHMTPCPTVNLYLVIDLVWRFVFFSIRSFVSIKVSLSPPHRAATVNMRWTRAGRRPTPLSTTTSATPPTTTPGGGSRRVSPVHRRTATPSPSRWWSRSPDRTRRPCPLCPRCSPRVPRLHSPRCKARAHCSGQREAGLPLPRCCPPNPRAIMAPSTGPQAAWAAPLRRPPRASRLLFDTQLSLK